MDLDINQAKQLLVQADLRLDKEVVLQRIVQQLLERDVSCPVE